MKNLAFWMELNTLIKILVFCISSFQSSWYFVFCILWETKRNLIKKNPKYCLHMLLNHPRLLLDQILAGPLLRNWGWRKPITAGLLRRWRVALPVAWLLEREKQIQQHPDTVTEERTCQLPMAAPLWPGWRRAHILSPCGPVLLRGKRSFFLSFAFPTRV
jgi:hypothetical protein